MVGICETRRYVPTFLMFVIVAYVTVDLQIRGFPSRYIFIGMLFIIPVIYYLLYDGHRWKDFGYWHGGVTHTLLRECLSCGKKQEVLYGAIGFSTAWIEKDLSEEEYERRKKKYTGE